MEFYSHGTIMAESANTICEHIPHVPTYTPTQTTKCLTSNSMDHIETLIKQKPVMHMHLLCCEVTFNSPVPVSLCKVFTRTLDGHLQLMWVVSSNQGQKWQYENILVGSSQPFTVVFEAQVGEPGVSDIALDDVSFTPSCTTGSQYLLSTSSLVLHN